MKQSKTLLNVAMLPLFEQIITLFYNDMPRRWLGSFFFHVRWHWNLSLGFQRKTGKKIEFWGDWKLDYLTCGREREKERERCRQIGSTLRREMIEWVFSSSFDRFHKQINIRSYSCNIISTVTQASNESKVSAKWANGHWPLASQFCYGIVARRKMTNGL